MTAVIMRRAAIVLACLALISAAAANGAAAGSGITADADGRFRDASGRSVIFRGVNAFTTSMIPNFQPSVSDEQLDALQAFGVNMFRLIVSVVCVCTYGMSAPTRHADAA